MVPWSGPAGDGAAPDLDEDRRTGGRVGHGVADEVGDDLVQAALVAQHEHRLVGDDEPDRPLPVAGLRGVHHIPGQHA
ncbi:hypothetical protein ACTWPT_50190 [Nonomuraea sp. 3N208]|uniref:hypothetical protein n=1 Tax=Nonomuraea sp. 3N208 TaxID=3457421 RepID=UPI003FD2555C